MNDNDCGSHPAQNPEPQTKGSATIKPRAATASPTVECEFPEIDLQKTLRRCLACNPLYLLSAALLLYSFYLVSADPNFLLTEVAKLSFNLGSLQLYEGLIIITAVFLARRAVWYDSTLLVGLENLLVLVPFILVSQAALIDAHLVWILCAAAGALAATRLGLLKRCITQLNAPPRLLGAGLLVLAINAALPGVYRVLHESKFGTKPDWGAAYETNQYVWWGLAPALCALSLAVPLKRSAGELWPQRRWLPLGLFSLWLAGTGAHLYCLGYVYDFALRPDLLAPAVWILCWVVSLRIEQCLPKLELGARGALWTLPAAATLLAAAQPGKEVFLLLTLVNVAIYGSLTYRRQGRLALHLLLISLLALIGGLPEAWGRSLIGHFSREAFVGGAAGLYLLACVTLSRNPKWGLLGALAAAFMMGHLQKSTDILPWAFQAGLVYLLLHSLRWEDSQHEGAAVVRWSAALSWVAHSIFWVHLWDGGWKPCLVAGAVLGVFLVYRWLVGRWGSRVVGLGALAVLVSAPIQLASPHLKATPGGLLAVLGSFLLFGLGTFAAIVKHRDPESQKHPSGNPAASQVNR